MTSTLSEPTPTTATPGPARLILGRSGAEDAEHGSSGAMAWVIQQAKLWGCPVVVVHAWMEYQPSVAGYGEQPWFDPSIWAEASAATGDAATRILQAEGISVTVDTRRDSASDAVLDAAEPSDQVVLGTASENALWHCLSANVVHGVLHKAVCPVVVVPDDWSPAGATQILVGYDESPRARAALGWGVTQCEKSGLELVVTRALIAALATDNDAAADQKMLAGVVALAARQGVGNVTLSDVDCVDGGPARALDAAAAHAYALVLGNHQASWLSELSGASVAERAALHACCPVVIVPRS